MRRNLPLWYRGSRCHLHTPVVPLHVIINNHRRAVSNRPMWAGYWQAPHAGWLLAATTCGRRPYRLLPLRAALAVA
ncbi:hypothetical protein GW17_00047078 [Ensete ventricosum]|nr:hypothetical protein GW17_00047078 [Ensete ventricosum]